MNAPPADSGAAYLLMLPRFADRGGRAYRPGLERIRALLDAMSDPQDEFESIHVAGTNGKGSTASMLASIATERSLRAGLHTSPHLLHVTERMRVDGVSASSDWLDEAVDRYRAVFARVEPSFFEATVALSFLYFAEQNVDVAVVEVGMGGRLDATNVLRPSLCLVTRIALDHTEHLGTTLTAIAREKAGIAKRGCPLLLYPGPADVEAAVRDACERNGAPLHLSRLEVETSVLDETAFRSDFSCRTPDFAYTSLRLPLGGAAQVENASLAVRGAEILWGTSSDAASSIARGLERVRENSGLRGRTQAISAEPLVVLDVAHNADAISRACSTLREHIEPRGGALHVLLSLMDDKDVEGVADIVSASAVTVCCVPLSTPRSAPVERLADAFRDHSVTAIMARSPREGLTHCLRRARDADAVLIVGSHVLAAEMLATMNERDRDSARALHTMDG